MGIPENLVSHGRNRKTGGRLQSIWNRLIWTQQTNREVISMGKWTHKPIDCGHLPSWTWTNHSEKREWWKTRTARWSGWAGGRTRRTGGGGGRPGRRRPAGEQPSQHHDCSEYMNTLTPCLGSGGRWRRTWAAAATTATGWVLAKTFEPLLLLQHQVL